MATVSAPRARGAFTHDEDGLVVARVRAGDIDAFEQLVVRHRDVAVRVAAGIVGRDEAEDVTQDAFLRALHRIDQYRGTAPFRAWLMRIVTNTALNTLERRRAIPVEDVEEPEPSPEGEALSPASMLERSEARERLAGKITRLRPEHRALVVLRDLEGLSYEEIMTITGLPEGTVKSRLHRARAALREAIERGLGYKLPE